MSDEGSCVVSSVMHNAQISEVGLTPTLDMEASSNDPLTELDSHANVVIVG